MARNSLSDNRTYRTFLQVNNYLYIQTKSLSKCLRYQMSRSWVTDLNSTHSYFYRRNTLKIIILVFIKENEQLSFAKATQLPAFLENEKQLLEEETKQLQYNRMLRDKQFRQLHEVCFRHCVCYSI